jgi:hypothetical protein
MKRIAWTMTILLLSALLCLGLGGCDKEKTAAEDGGMFSVTYRGTVIEIGKEAEDVLKALGEPQNKKEIGDCGGLGAQVRYDYSSLVLYVLESKDGAVIDQITLTDDLVATEKGICIGDSQEKVKEAYGDTLQDDGSRWYYRSGKNRVTFKIEDGKVTGIDLMQVTQ